MCSDLLAASIESEIRALQAKADRATRRRDNRAWARIVEAIKARRTAQLRWELEIQNRKEVKQMKKSKGKGALTAGKGGKGKGKGGKRGC